MSFDVFPIAMLILAFALANYGSRYYRVRLYEKATVTHHYQLSGEYIVGYWKEPKVKKVSDGDLKLRLESILVEFERAVETRSMYLSHGNYRMLGGQSEAGFTTDAIAERIVSEVKSARRLTK